MRKCNIESVYLRRDVVGHFMAMQTQFPELEQAILGALEEHGCDIGFFRLESLFGRLLHECTDLNTQ